ncbi:Fic family protein [Brachybacterium kimchii]|uniref:Fic family protein n=1 Tax=Brachybacterium kimchii TaxID=2942909 RepID=A0ABY4N559_9MICO|nr:Fic family protein [Brachybacterium kimchii]UQN28520.1 Fic family protein [Brachybacterium kimchii]
MTPDDSEYAGSAWPRTTTEEREWTPSERMLATLDAFERHRISRPYRAVLAPEIATATPHLPGALLVRVMEASEDISRFDEQMTTRPLPMPAVLLRSESASSSQIEHLSTSARQLAFASLGLSDRENAQLVAANVEAMSNALSADGPVDAALILQVHEALLGESQSDIVGRFRDQQVWIGGRSTSPHRADFVAPHHERVSAAIDDLSAFAARTDLPPLVQTALAHAQFETIHPFEDGNGRTGRVLAQLVLRRRGLARHTTLPISSGLLQNTDAYFSALTAYRDGDPAPIVEQMSQAAHLATESGRMLDHELRGLRDRWTELIRARTDSTAWRLADLLFAQPVVNAAWAARQLEVTDRSARTALGVLEEAGVVSETTAARRNRVWQAKQVLDLLDDHASRLGRRA